MITMIPTHKRHKAFNGVKMREREREREKWVSTDPLFTYNVNSKYFDGHHWNYFSTLVASAQI
jgi:hypothetical protein